jgi:type VI protein secretion system component VasF
VSPSTDPRDAEERALAQALREQTQQEETPDVSEALQKRIAAESRDSGVGYVVVQVVLLGALVAAAVWYFWV